MGAYKPWGLLSWVIGKLPSVKWNLLGAISPEDRSLAAWQVLSARRCLRDAYLAVIEDPPSRFSSQVSAKIGERKQQLDAAGGQAQRDCHGHSLFAKHAEIVGIVDSFLDAAGPNVVIDISSMPKRYFFPLVRRLLTASKVKNLLATYTRPLCYTQENLAENLQPLQYLPLFGGAYPDEGPTIVVVGVGYQILGLPEQLEHYGHGAVTKLLFPFPPGPPSFQRNWEFVRILQKNIVIRQYDIVPISAHDAPDAFDHIVSFSNRGKQRVAFAPYGPKPTSLAMCIYATLTDSPVLYTQPRSYHPDYSSGVACLEGMPETYAYCLRLDGKVLYGL